MPVWFLFLFYVAISLLPLGLAWSQGLPPRPILDEIASGAGLLAMSVLLAEFLLLSRYRVVARKAGTDIVMRMHQLLARAAAILALIHPFLYTARRQTAPDWDVSRQYFVTNEFWAIWPGALAWVLLPTLVLLAIGRSKMDFKYETWRLTHGLGSVLIAGFGVLHTVRAGRYSADPVLSTVWWVLLGIALLALVNTYLLRPFWRSLRPWKVTAVEPVGTRTWEVSVTPEGDHKLAYEAGQFAWLNIGHSPFSLAENPFSISSAPANGPEVRFIIKELGDTTNKIGQVQPGTRAYLDAPHGHLTIKGRKAKGVALIAGGVGIAPMMGILRELHRTGDTRPTTLIYTNRSRDQIARPNELEQLSAEHGTKIIHSLSEPDKDWTGEVGFITPALLQREFGDDSHRDWIYVLCGPPAMLEVVEEALINLGIPSSRIISERFSYD
ncbi:ferredoxin reductase family protein [Actibacterium pelagium]|uniref:Ferric reductase n=1 Tax=Actibacterium pelagium TaxID=2029103 RepID=A0A917AG24_9RHOB|nr:ferric reductase-like transmembrane domain-containing protein [Actibacterium pelagium]GGE49220.1 ferric reductase [Actibacterium pelagium]